MRTNRRTIRSAFSGSTPSGGEPAATKRARRLTARVAAVSLLGAGMALLGWAPSAFAADTSSTTVSATSPTIVLGDSNTASATVSGDATFGNPTGTVTFYECGPTTSPTDCTSTANPVGSAVGVTAAAGNTSTAGSASFTPTSTGYWCFAAAYSGDTNYSASADTTSDGCFDVTAASTSTSSAPASSSIVLGTSNSDNATVTGNAAGGSPDRRRDASTNAARPPRPHRAPPQPTRWAVRWA